MPRFAAAIGLLVAMTLSGELAHAERKLAVGRSGGADKVYVDGRRMWTGASGERVVSAVRWSKQADAVAFVVRRKDGADQLVVVLVGGDADKHTMRWPIPSSAAREFGDARGRRGRPTVTWMGQQRVAYGPSELRPTIVASWTLR